MEGQIYEIHAEGHTLRLVGLGDLHVGNINCDKAKFEEIIEWIRADPYCFWIGMGDYADAITFQDRRFDKRTLDPDLDTPPLQYDYVYGQFEKIKERCLGLHVGNHDEDLAVEHQRNYVLRDLCKTLNVTYLGDMAFTHLKVFVEGNTKTAFQIFSLHGHYSGRRGGGKENRLEDIAAHFLADIYLMGHVHDIRGWRIPAEMLEINPQYPQGFKLIEKNRIYVLTGGFLRGYQLGTSSYVEKRALQPSKIGIAVILIDPMRRDLHVST